MQAPPASHATACMKAHLLGMADHHQGVVVCAQEQGAQQVCQVKRISCLQPQ